MDRKSLKRRAAVSLFLNALTFVLVAFCIARFFTAGGEGNMQVVGWIAFRYFTVDSNVLAAIGAAAMLFPAIRALRTGEERTPRALLLFRYVGVAAVGVTFFTVLFFLGPIYGYPAMYVGYNLFLHLLCPLFCFLSFLLLEGRREELPVRFFWLGVLPVVLYGALYFARVIVVGDWPDFYAFNYGGRWYISMAAMLAATALLSCLFLLFFARIRKKGTAPAPTDAGALPL